MPYWNNYPIIQNRLQTVCTVICTKVKIRNAEVQTALTDFSTSGGKLLRPAFFLLFSDLGALEKQEEEQLLKIAASVELLHMATLIHDDIIDDSPLRRGAASVQSRYGKDIAVFTGDLLFTVFFELLIETMNGSEFMTINAQSMKRLLLGELDQMHTRYNQRLTFRDYLRAINGKTAQLFWLACKQGAYFGHADKKTQRLAGRIGRNIGLAFQIYDDILDYTADTKTLKKPVLEDLAQGVYTLPLLLAYQEAPAHFTPYLAKKELLLPKEAGQVAQLVAHHGGTAKAKAIAQRFAEKALADIRKLPDRPAKALLEQLTLELLERTF